MNHVLFDTDDDGCTAIDPDEKAQLIPSYISIRFELNQAELQNIERADRWAFSRRRNVLEVAFLKNLHKRMFNEVWLWAGKYRTTGRNIGVDAYRIDTDLHQLLNDVIYWINASTYCVDEIGVRFHHRLVSIHPFPNGNGRHARLAADLLAVQLGELRFTWGRERVTTLELTRQTYIEVLRSADRHDIGPLLSFVRT